MHFVGVGDELGDGFLLVFMGLAEQLISACGSGVNVHLLPTELLEECERGFNLCYLAFVLDDAPHGVGDVLPGVGILLVEDGVPVVESAAEVAVFVLQGGDGVVDAGDVVDDALDCGVAVCPACCAVALGLGSHGVSVLVGVWSMVRIVGMDFSTLFSGGSAIAAIVSVFFAIVSWYQSLGSKKAKAKAEEAHRAALEMRDAAVRAAKAAEERARQMERIVAEQQKQSESQAKIESHLWRPTFELTPDRGDTYLLRNVTNESVEVLEVANLDDFVRCNQIQQVFRPGESLRVFMFGASGKPLPSNLELRIRGVDEVVPVPIRR